MINEIYYSVCYYDMTILSSGAFCDVCDNYILPLVDKEGKDEMVNCFRIKGIDRDLHCHNDCKKLLLSIGNDWKKLPDGNIKRAFEEHSRINPPPRT